MSSEMARFFDTALDNIAKYGDTDIFPFPIENYVLRDKKAEILAILQSTYAGFREVFNSRPPQHINVLAPTGFTGFRWASQQDPFWNAFLLGLTLSLASDLEKERIPTEKKMIFSYRLNSEMPNGSLFREDIGWRDFMTHSVAMAQQAKYVLVCDISDCYQRIPHHRLDNALRLVDRDGVAPQFIMQILGHYSNGRSYSVPVGGPAARILVEALLNLSDKILRQHGFLFARYADDYHIFVESVNDAYESLRFLSEKLLRNEGLALQKSKTRIMSSAEFASSQAMLLIPDEDDINSDIRHLFALNLRYDPYSDTADDDYESLKHELDEIDILGILNRELAKTRVHGAVTKKLVQAIRYIDPVKKEGAVLTLVGSLNALYPIFSVVAMLIKTCFPELTPGTQSHICDVLREKISSGDFTLSTDLHAAYALRILSEMGTPENIDSIISLHRKFNSPVVRRDVILSMARWREFAWLSDQINDFQSVSSWERRALIIASYKMGDAGSAWRDRMKRYFDPFELVVRDWAADRSKSSSWVVPI